MGIFNINIKRKGDLIEEIIHYVYEASESGSILYLADDGLYHKATAALKEKSTTELVILLNDADVDTPIEIMTVGEYIFNSPSLVPGAKYYLSVISGGITTSRYIDTNNVIRYIGTALNDVTLVFNPDQTYISDDGTKVNDVEIKTSLRPHTHVEADISDLDKYTVAEVDEHIHSTGEDHFYIDQDVTMTATPAFGGVYLNGIQTEGFVGWNIVDHTLNIHTGVAGTIIQVGLETLVHVYNNTASPILNGKAVYPIGSATNGLPNIGLCIADSFETIQFQVGIVTGTIPAFSDGFVTIVGNVRGIDTSALSLGPVYISSTIPGDLTSIKPSFVNYAVLMGVVTVVNPTTGNIIVDIRSNYKDTLDNFWNGTFREAFDFNVTSNGTTITGSLSPSNGHPNMTMLFSDDFTTLITTPSITIPLIAGTNILPQENFIYIPRSTKVLTVSTAGFPEEEYIKVATTLLQTPLTVQTYGALKNHTYNDHIEDSINFQGHLTHITERLRREPAVWESGTEGTCIGLPTNVYVNVTGGKVYQLHKQDFFAKSMPTDSIVVVNDFTNPYKYVTNLKTESIGGNGVDLKNTSFAFVIWGVVNSDNSDSKIMVNKPIGTYPKNDTTATLNDQFNYSVYTIPRAFQGVGFLIARLIFSLGPAGTTWTLDYIEDLRGRLPNSTAGSGSIGGQGVSTFDALTDTPNSKVGQANKIVKVGATETALEYLTPNTAFNKNYSVVPTDIKVNGIQSLGVLDTLPRADHVHPRDLQSLAYNGGTGELSISDSNSVNIGNLNPIGLEGQVYYINEDGTSNLEPSFILKEGTIVDSQAEFDSIAIEGISLADVFTSWYLFAHSNGGTQLSPPTFPGLDPTGSQGTALTQALYDSGNTWGYDPVGDRIYLTQNFGPYTGFISPKKFQNFTLEATLSSTNSDNDVIGLIIGFYVDPLTGYEHTLSIVRTLSPSQWEGVSYGLYYNFSQTTQQLISDGTTLAPFPIPASGWIGKPTRLQIIRTNDVFTIKTSQFGGTIIDDLTLITVDVSLTPILNKFMTGSQVGFSAKSQARAYFSDIVFSGFNDYIFFPDGSGGYETWEWNPTTEVYFLQDPKTVFSEDYFGRGRFIYSPLFGKTYYITENDEIIKIGSGAISNVLERTSSLINDGEILGGGDRFLLLSEIESFIPPSTVDTETVLINGDVIWQSGLTFYVYATKYKIAGILREGFLSATVTLGVADVTNGRIDSFIIRNNGLGHSIENDSIVVIPGIPSSEPAKQVLDNELELEISFATIDANAIIPTTPSDLNTEIVYAENVEWTVVGATGTVNAASTSSPITGTVSILHTNPEHQKNVYFTTPISKFTSSNAVLQFNIKLETVWEYRSSNGTTIDVYLWKNNTRFTGRIRVGSDLGLNFDPYNITDVQTVFIRFDRFANIFNSNDYNKIQFQYQRANNDIFRIDNIKIIEGYGGVSQDAITIPTKTSELLNDGANSVNPFITALDITGKEDVTNKSQDIELDKLSTSKYGSVKAIYDWAVGKFQLILISGTNIRTIEGNTLLGSSDITLPIKASKTAEITASITLNNTYNNKVLYLSANATITIPTGLMEDFEWNVITKPGFTLTYVLASGVTALNNTGLTMAEKLMMTGKKIGTTEVYFLIGI